MAKNAVLDESTRRLVATEEDQEHLNFPEDSKSTGRLVASGNADTKGKDKIWPHNLQISTDCEPHMEKVFSIVRERYGLSPRDRRENSRSESSNMGYISCPSLFKLQEILVQTTRIICVLPRISPRNH